MLGLLSTRDSAPIGAAPEASAGALRTAAESPLFASAQSASGSAASALMAERYIYAVDVPISTEEVKRWQSTLDLVPALVQTASPDSASRFWSPEAVAALPSLTGEQQAVVHKLAPFPSFVASRVVALPMTKVLRTRREWLPYRQRFPVHQVRIALLDAVMNHAVVALIGSSGTGRTLQLPLMLAETDVFKRCRTVLVVANAVAARLTVRRLREERGEDVCESRSVAFVLPAESEATEGTTILVTTAEVLIRQLLCDPLLQGVGCVIFDDTHLRNETTELCFASVRAALMAVQAASRVTTTEAGTGGEVAANTNTADAASARTLRVVLNCPDETCAAPLLAYFKPNGAVPFGLPALTSTSTSSGGAAPSAVEPVLLHVDETVCWLAKCDKEGSALCTQPDQELASLVENVDVAARVLAAIDSDFSDDAKRRRYWVPLMAQSLVHYDRADRQRRAAHPSAALPLVVVIAPDMHTQHALEKELRRALASSSSSASIVENEENPRPSPFALCSLSADDRECATQIARVVAGTTPADPQTQRLVLLCTPELAQSALPFSLQIGLVLDCARVTYATTSPHTSSDLWEMEYAPIQSLRYRRAVGRLTATDAGAVVPMVLQLIPKRILHSTQHRRQSTDPAHHALFRLPFARYVQLYQLLQAREEALGSQFSAHDAAARAARQQSLGSRISTLAASLFVAVPAATSNRYDALRRTLALVEAQLVAAGHVELAASTHGQGTPTYARLKALGVATVCVPLPACVTRLLCLGAAIDCPREAALLAALVLVGDLFSNVYGSETATTTTADGARDAEDDTSEATRHALLAETRQYFSGDSKSDMAVSFNVYKMWCESRASTGSSEAAAAGETEQAFLDECGASRSALLAVAHLHATLYCQVRQLFPMPAAEAAAEPSGEANEDEETAPTAAAVVPTEPVTPTRDLHGMLAAAVCAMPESPIVHGPLALCLTGALYPNCLVPQADGSAFLLETTVGNQTSTKRVGVFTANSLVADSDTAAGAAGKPFVYASKAAVAVPVATDGASEATTEAGGARVLSVVSQVTPLLPAASILLCGEGTEDVRPLPSRCRGWRPALTDGWRRTRLARPLPPPSQLPTPSIAVLPYDTVRAEQVMVSTDCTFHYAMRQTTSRWLMQLRRSLQRQLTSLALHRPTTVDDDSSLQLARRLNEAWSWYEARERSGKHWLRDERANLSKELVAAAAATVEAEAEEAAAQTTEESTTTEKAPVTAQSLRGGHRLLAFYHFSTTPGLPSAVTAPTAAAAERAAATLASTRAEGREGATARAADPAGTGAAGSDFTVLTGADAHRVPDTYTGKRPTADEEEIFRMCVESVAESRSRSAEAELLRDKPKVFAFLDPDNEFHEYYLYLLRQRAPDLEVLGDNVEELVEFLESLEDELRAEAGLPTREEMAAAQTHAYDEDGGEDGQWDVVEPDAYAADGQPESSVFDTGLQMETNVLHLQKDVGPTLARPAVAATEPVSGTSLLSAPVPGAGAAAFPAPSSGGPSNLADQPGQTLMDRLMSMAHPGAAPVPSEAAPPSAADLLALMDACLPSSAVPDPTAAQGAASADTTTTATAAANALASPPPPIPAKDIEERAPSIIVYPLPDAKWGNVPHLLVRALGETLDIRLGPAIVVGTVARIAVPNRQVELRALAKKSFTCLGEKVYIFKNDRVIDNPDRHARRRPREHEPGVLAAPMPGLADVPGSILGVPSLLAMPVGATPVGGILGDRPAGWFPAPDSLAQQAPYPAYMASYPAPAHASPPAKVARTEMGQHDEAAVYQTAPAHTVPLTKIGVLTDDDDDDDDSSASSSSSSSSSEEGSSDDEKTA